MVFSKIKVTLVSVFALLVMASPAAASNSNGFGYVSQVYGMGNGSVMFSVAASRTGTIPPCAATSGVRWVIDASTVSGQAAAQVLIMAYTHHLQIYVTGIEVCSIWGDTETVNYIYLADPPY